MIASMFAVMAGGALGCLMRWGLGLGLNRFFPAVPPGTLVANYIGAYLIGLSMAYFGAHPELSPQWRLLVITGFLGGLTTFSSFSGEVVLLLQQGRVGVACAAISAHVIGSLVLTVAGMATVMAARATWP